MNKKEQAIQIIKNTIKNPNEYNTLYNCVNIIYEFVANNNISSNTIFYFKWFKKLLSLDYSPRLLYRGLRVKSDVVNKDFLSNLKKGKPMYLKSTKEIQSWTDSKKVADNFISYYDEYIGLLVSTNKIESKNVLLYVPFYMEIQSAILKQLKKYFVFNAIRWRSILPNELKTEYYKRESEYICLIKNKIQISDIEIRN